MDSPPSIQYCETLFLDAYDIQKQVQGTIHATVDLASSFCFGMQNVELFARRSVFRRVTGRLALNCSQTWVFPGRTIRRLGKKFLKRGRVYRTLLRTTVGRKHVGRHFRSCRNQAFLAIKRRSTLSIDPLSHLFLRHAGIRWGHIPLRSLTPHYFISPRDYLTLPNPFKIHRFVTADYWKCYGGRGAEKYKNIFVQWEIKVARTYLHACCICF